MRIGILYLVLQAVLLCATVQAAPVAADAFAPDVASLLQAPGCGGGVAAEDNDADDDLHTVAVPILRPGAEIAPLFSTVGLLPLPRPREGHAIRAPPSLT